MQDKGRHSIPKINVFSFSCDHNSKAPKFPVFLNGKETHGASTISRFHFNSLIFRKSKVFHATRELKCILKQNKKLIKQNCLRDF